MSEFINFVSPQPTSHSVEEPIRAASDCLDRFTAFFNACDTRGMDGELHFPHLMLSGSLRMDWPSAGQHPGDFFTALRATGWHHTRYESKQAVLASADKVHFFVTYSRRSSIDATLSMHANLWIVTKIAEKWGISVRSY
jgi:hypothetical protein